MSTLHGLPELPHFWHGMALHLWQTTVVLVALAMVGWGLRDAPARYTAALLWIGLLKLAIPTTWLTTLLQPWLSSWIGSPTHGAPIAPRLTEYVSVVLQPVALSLPSDPTGIGLSLYVTLTGVWIAGVAFLLGRWWRRSRPHPTQSVSDPDQIPSAIRNKIRVALTGKSTIFKSIRIATGSGVVMTRGVWRPRILISQDLVEALPEDELRAVLLHEEHHCRRRDTLLTAIQYGIAAVFFFYPPVWWLVQRLRAVTESTCDESVLDAGVTAEVYARALARVVAAHAGILPSLQLTDACLSQQRGLSARLDRIENSGRYQAMTKHRIFLLASVVTIGSFVAATMLVAADRTPVPDGQREPELSVVADRVAEGRFAGLVGRDSLISIRLKDVSLKTVLRVLEDQTSTKFRIDAQLGKKRVDFMHQPTTLESALRLLASNHRLEYQVIDGWTVGVSELPVAEEQIFLSGVAGVTNPRLIPESKVQPVYPEAAAEDKVASTVIYQVVVDTDGAVGQIEVLREKHPDYDFASAGEAALSRWRYEPAQKDGKPVPVYITVFMEFKTQ